MALTQIKSVVEKFITDNRNELLVIKGKWGVGKTFFWQKLIEESKRKKQIGRNYYSYVSLFGLDNIEELKTAIVASRVQWNAGKLKEKVDSLTTRLKELGKTLNEIPALRGYPGVVSNILFYSLNDTLICLDDIERKGNRLDVTHVFGLACLLKEQRGCKVVLIMNDDSLDGDAREQFKLHGEKIIDREVTFSIATEESFGYVFEPSVPTYDLIKNCCLNLQIRNIRTLQRVKRFIEDVASYLTGSEDSVVDDILRSLILFVWSYYDKSSDTVPLEFILRYSFADSFVRSTYKNETTTVEGEKWEKVLGTYNYLGADEIDKCLAELVETGYLNEPTFTALLNAKNDQCKAQQGSASYGKTWDIYSNSFADNEQEFVDNLISRFRSNMRILSLGNLQGAVAILRDFERNEPANSLIDDFFGERKSEEDLEGFRRAKRGPFSGELRDEYLLSRLQEISTITVVDDRTLGVVLRSITSKEFLSYQDVSRLDSFETDDYYKFLKSEESEDLYDCVRKCLDFDERDDEKWPYKSIARKTREALLRIASESRINRVRVSRLYKIDLDLTDAN